MPSGPNIRSFKKSASDCPETFSTILASSMKLMFRYAHCCPGASCRGCDSEAFSASSMSKYESENQGSPFGRLTAV